MESPMSQLQEMGKDLISTGKQPAMTIDNSFVRDEVHFHWNHSADFSPIIYSSHACNFLYK